MAKNIYICPQKNFTKSNLTKSLNSSLNLHTTTTFYFIKVRSAEKTSLNQDYSLNLPSLNWDSTVQEEVKLLKTENFIEFMGGSTCR